MCISKNPYLQEQNGFLVVGVHGGEMVGLDIGGIYDACAGDADYYRVIDNSGEDYLYPKTMFVEITGTKLLGD